MRNMLRNTYQDIAKVEYIIRMCEPIFLPPILQNRKKKQDTIPGTRGGALSQSPPTCCTLLRAKSELHGKEGKLLSQPQDRCQSS